ncbi:CLUMA_CG013147, isoform A [Clunio marinus]|uniref:CLUMA_CG013147, isoform A n=1 Tax=Clunio marinus TaxID=568069 RepID=A0A1J1IJX6_9DIPT|nr:CLUMA_CG013147, isoform A [Clunio marinus]
MVEIMQIQLHHSRFIRHNFINAIKEFDEDDDQGLQMMPILSKIVVSPSPHPSMVSVVKIDETVEA